MVFFLLKINLILSLIHKIKKVTPEFGITLGLTLFVSQQQNCLKLHFLILSFGLNLIPAFIYIEVLCSDYALV